MKIIAKKLGRTDRHDWICCIRRDGTRTEAPMPRQGIAPHDLLHYLVESRLAMTDAFLGMVAQGAELNFVMERLHDVKGACAAQAAQAEAVVESLQAQLWSGSFDNEAFHAGLAAACSMRGVPAPELMPDVEAALFRPAQQLGEQWSAQPFHSEMTFVFD